MTERELNRRFNRMNSSELASVFPSLYERTMASADPAVNINTFVREARLLWKTMPKEQKEKSILKF